MTKRMKKSTGMEPSIINRKAVAATTLGQSPVNQSKAALPKMNDQHIKGSIKPQKPSSSSLEFDKPSSFVWWTLLVVITVLAFGTRFYNLEVPRHICWDETHFGKMGSWYINRTFFFDVHPPLGKMLIGLSGYLTGYDGSFEFNKPGDKYDDVPYMGMRMFCAGLGAGVIVLCYCIAWEMSRSLSAAVLSSLLVTFDTGVLTLSQYILLDPLLLFFIMAATYSLLKFTTTSQTPFSCLWWFWLFTTGVFLACSIGVKFVGLFVILLAGYTVACDLWAMLGNLQISMVTIMKHFLARAVGLILLPVLVYMAFFFVHFKVLNKSGASDGFYSSAFQSRLEGNPLYNISMPQYVAYGSVVTLKNHRTSGAYLHSHWHLYPEGVGARQQQVTTYSHKDENNKWLVKPADTDTTAPSAPAPGPALLVHNGDLVRLEHVVTKRNLHSHREMAPLSKQQYQVTCYGENGYGDMNDIFRVVIPGVSERVRLNNVRSVFRLVHHSAGCAVQSDNKKLPKWGWDQLEVTCNPNTRDKKSLWNVEEVSDARLPNSSFEVYSPTFLEMLVESHAVMTQGNKGLKPKDGEVTSRPWMWPVNYKGQPFSGVAPRVYLLGNPVIWWSNLAVMVLYAVYAVCTLAWRQYRLRGDAHGGVKQDPPLVLCSCGWLLLAWALHYVPFWSMTRVLYFHHYFPALLYSCILTGVFTEFVMSWLSSMFSQRWVVYHSLLGAVISILAYSFVVFSPLSYGMDGPSSQEPYTKYSSLRWLPTWDF